MRAGSLCTGYGGLDLAVDALLGTQTAWLAEFDPNASKVCDARFPGVPNLHDITTVDWAALEPVDVLTAGYPCQPFSHAGRRKGTDDPRHLWPHIARALRVLRPRLVVLENVAGHLSLGFDAVLGDLAELGFDAEWCVVRASDVGACHQRKRLFVVATDATPADGRGRRVRCEVGGQEGRGGTPSRDGGRAPSDAGSEAGRWTGHALCGDGGPADGGGGPKEPRGRCGAASDAGGERHGRGQDPRGLGRVDQQDASGPRERERPRSIAGDRSAPPHPDADDLGREGTVAGSRRDDRGDGPGSAADADQHGRARRDDARGGEGLGQPRCEPAGAHPAVAWGVYEPAIRRHERLVGRLAPSPVDERGRLAAPFVEWMMCLPAGWVTDILGRTAALKALGNGVVPPQAAYAIAHLLDRSEEAWAA